MLLGGAALTRSYVENDLSTVYEGDVRYARDAFEGLRLMDGVMAAQARRGAGGRRRRGAAKVAERKARHERSRRIAERRKAAEPRPATGPLPARSDVAHRQPVPTPPFWGSRVVKGIAAGRVSPCCDERATVPGPVGAARRAGRSRVRATRSWSRPRAGRGCGTGWTGCPPSGCCEAAVVYGYFPCVSEGDDAGGARRAAGRAPPSGTGSPSRGSAATGTCAWPTSSGRARTSGEVDVVALHLVTMGQPIADYANELFAEDAYRDYLEVHGLAVQLTEALAEYWHRRIRAELRVRRRRARSPPRTPTDVEEFFELGYRGARYSLRLPGAART